MPETSMRLIITGASGLLGSAIVFQSRTAYEVLAITHRHSLVPKGFDTITADLTNPSDLNGVIRDFQPDWICHCAGATNVDECEVRPEMARRLNVDVTRKMAELATAAGAAFLYVSTDSVFDGEAGSYRESDSPHPVNEYARTKLAGERAAMETGGHTLVVRCNFYGFNIEAKQSLSEWILSTLRKGDEVSGWANVTFAPLYNVTLASLLLRMMELRLAGIYHAGSRDSLTKYEFARAIADRWGFSPEKVRKTQFGAGAGKAQRPLNTSLNVDRLQARGLELPNVRDDLRLMASWEATALSEFRSLLAA